MPGPPPPPPPPPPRADATRRDDDDASLAAVLSVPLAAQRAQLQDAAAEAGALRKTAKGHALLLPSPAARQRGPSCGLLALALAAAAVRRGDEEEADDGAGRVDGDVRALLAHARAQGWSREGEAFDAALLAASAAAVLDGVAAECVAEPLRAPDVVALLAAGAAVLVAYDADFDHSPRQTGGANAHWALVVGCFAPDVGQPAVRPPCVDIALPFVAVPDELCVVVRHGKTTHLRAWPLAQLAASNAQLGTASTVDRERYVVPADLGEHLANRYIVVRRAQ